MSAETDEQDAVLVERRDGVQVITINRPHAKNALNGAVARGIAAAVDELDADDDLRVGRGGALHQPVVVLRRPDHLDVLLDREEGLDPLPHQGVTPPPPPHTHTHACARAHMCAPQCIHTNV